MCGNDCCFVGGSPLATAKGVANGVYRAVSGSIAQLRRLDVLANNLAHVDVPGYKADEVRFEEVLGRYGKTGHVEAAETRTNLSQGAFRETGNPLDVALSGPGFLVVDTPQGQRLTRAGELVIGPSGQIETRSGHAVMGDRGAITVPPLGPDTAGPLRIDVDGRVSRGDLQIGRLRRVDADAQQLTKVGDQLFAVNTSVEALPDAAQSKVLQGHLEEANVSPVAAMIEMITVQRTFDALQQAMKAYRQADSQSVRRAR